MITLSIDDPTLGDFYRNRGFQTPSPQYPHDFEWIKNNRP